jgi:Domain of unknown function (DUF4347)
VTVHLMVIGRRPPEHAMPDDGLIEAVTEIVTKQPELPETTFFVRRCRFPRDLVQIVRRVALEHGRIDSLDLYDHGSPGKQRMGQDILFNSEEKNLDIATALRPLLAEHARLRLLGCDTAWGMNGRKMLLDVRNALDPDHRVIVYGTIALVAASEFGITGFVRKHLEEQYLVSSTEVQNQRARTYDERADERRAWAAEQSALLRDDTPNPDSEV